MTNEHDTGLILVKTETVEPYRDRLSEVDIHCRFCRGSLGDLLHICPKRLTAQCRNCSGIFTIHTEIGEKH